MTKSDQILIIDSTLRDGSHAVSHQFTKKQITDYSKGAEKALIKILIVGHGNGLGASSLQLGMSLLKDEEMLRIAKSSLHNTKLGAFLIPGFGTIKDNLEPAIKAGITDLMIASHCTESNITKQHIEYCVKNKIKPYGVLMMAHMSNPKSVLYQAQLMESYGASAVLLMDSAGAMLPSEVKRKVMKLVKHLTIPVGFHAHNNLGMAIANSVTAVESGAIILDTTARGLGAGAGNCQLEVIVAVLKKMGYKIDLDLNQLMDNSENIIKPIMQKAQEISLIELSSSLAGVFSGFAPHAKKAAKKFNVDVRDIFIELGKRKVVAGQEDLIIDVAAFIAKNPQINDQNKFFPS